MTPNAVLASFLLFVVAVAVAYFGGFAAGRGAALSLCLKMIEEHFEQLKREANSMAESIRNGKEIDWDSIYRRAISPLRK